jgi:hypothetical protein
MECNRSAVCTSFRIRYLHFGTPNSIPVYVRFIKLGISFVLSLLGYYPHIVSSVAIFNMLFVDAMVISFP